MQSCWVFWSKNDQRYEIIYWEDKEANILISLTAYSCYLGFKAFILILCIQIRYFFQCIDFGIIDIPDFEHLTKGPWADFTQWYKIIQLKARIS